jgi:hypothetical protein
MRYTHFGRYHHPGSLILDSTALFSQKMRPMPLLKPVFLLDKDQSFLYPISILAAGRPHRFLSLAVFDRTLIRLDPI